MSKRLLVFLFCAGSLSGSCQWEKVLAIPHGSQASLKNKNNFLKTAEALRKSNLAVSYRINICHEMGDVHFGLECYKEADKCYAQGLACKNTSQEVRESLDVKRICFRVNGRPDLTNRDPVEMKQTLEKMKKDAKSPLVQEVASKLLQTSYWIEPKKTPREHPSHISWWDEGVQPDLKLE